MIGPRSSLRRKLYCFLQCITCTVCCWCIIAQASPWQGLEREGVSIMRGATEAYGKAYDCWSEIESLAVKLAEPSLKQTSRARRLNLAVSMLDSNEFSVLAKGGDDPLRVPVLVTRAGRKIDGKELGEIIRILSLVRQRYPLQHNAEARDLPLVYEALAVLHGIHGDSIQQRADACFRKALAAIEVNSRPSPEGAAAAIRLQFMLRDFKGAWTYSTLHQDLLEKADRDTRLRTLALLARAAKFLGYGDSLLSIRAQISALGGKAEQAPRPRSRFAGLSVGSRAELTLVASGVVRLLASCELRKRDRALLAFIASLSALELGEYALARELLEVDLAGLGYPWLEAAVTSRAGMACELLGDFEGALHLLKRARVLAVSSGAAAFVARLDLNEAAVLMALGKPVVAGERARGLVRSPAAPLEVRIRARILMGAALYERGRSEPERLSQALRVFHAVDRELDADAARKLPGKLELELTNSIYQANILRKQARALGGKEKTDRYRKAISLQDDAMRRAGEAGNTRLSAIAGSNLGELYLESGSYESAEKFTRWSLDRAVDSGQFETQWRCRWYLARIAEKMGRRGEAEEHLGEAVRIVESYRARILDVESKTGFMTDKLDMYRYLVRREMSGGRAARALEFAERSRARALVESMGWRFVTLADPDGSRLYRQYVSLNGRANLSGGGGTMSLLGVRGAREDFNALRERLAAVKQRLQHAALKQPLLGLLVDGAPATAAEIIAELPEDTALLEYFSLGDSLAVFLVQDEKVTVAELKVNPRKLADTVRRYLAGSAADQALSSELYKQLLSPIAARVKKSRVLIIPHGALHRLPFETLTGPGGFQVEKWTISYLQSASLLRYLRLNSVRGGAGGPSVGRKPLKLLALADPDTDYDRDGKPNKVSLVHARNEVAAFSPGFRESVVLSGIQARESVIAALSRGQDVIHFACHGEFYPARPWESTLFLAPGGEGSKTSSRDGRLKAWEIYAMDLKGNRLVTLSGCETGRNEIQGGDDPVGLATAFLHCGAGALLVSLWKVEDAATAELMSLFYDYWIRRGRDRVDALRQAKLAMLKGKYSHPRQWAAFVFVGDR